MLDNARVWMKKNRNFAGAALGVVALLHFMAPMILADGADSHLAILAPYLSWMTSIPYLATPGIMNPVSIGLVAVIAFFLYAQAGPKAVKKDVDEDVAALLE